MLRKTALILTVAGLPSFGQALLTLSSATSNPGAPVAIPLTLTTQSGSGPAAIQWTLTYNPAQISAIAATAGPALTAAGKSISCNSTPGSYTCVAYGMNTTTIANGVAASVSVTAAATGSISVDQALGATADGSAITVSGVAGTVTIPVVPVLSAPTSVWQTAAPTERWRSDSPVTLGLKFRSDAAGQVTGIRFWKDSSSDNGTHIGLLYSNTGAVLARATFTSETGSGWQLVTFPNPVTIAANTTYIAAYHTTSGWSADGTYFVGKGADAPPLHALANGVDGSNGMYSYGSSPQFPTTSRGANYWVDVAFTAGSTSAPGDVSIWQTANPSEHWRGDNPVTLSVKFRSDVAGQVKGIRFWKDSASDNGVHVGLLYSSTGTVLAQATFTSETGSGWQQVNFSTPVNIAANTTYVAAYFTTSGWSSDGTYFVGKGADTAPLHALANGVDGINGMYIYGSTPQFPTVSRGANYWVDVVFAAGTTTTPPATGATSIWQTASPTEHWRWDNPVTLSVKFRSDVAGQITGIRFWKDSTSDNGAHLGLLYSSTGALLAQATFTSETSSGWQQVNFPTPVSITANTTYVAAYFTTSGWSSDGTYFVGKGADSAPLHALANGVDGINGMYIYGMAPQFPTVSRGANYWVDVVLKTN